jgi:hypothetical protein
MNKENDKLNQAIDALRNVHVPQGPSDQLIHQTLNRIAQTQPQTTPNTGTRRFSMKTFIKLAVAASILIGISAVFLFPTGGKSIALAAVYNKVQQVQAFMYTMSMTMTGSMAEGTPAQNIKVEAIVTISTEHGMIMDSTMHLIDKNQTTHQQMYYLPAEKTMVMVMPDQKTYMRMEFTEDLFERTKQQSSDPREMIKHMMDSKYTDLGFSEINGIKVQGFQTTDPAYAMGTAEEVSATLWVDVDTGLPIRSEYSMKTNTGAQMHGGIDHFQWNMDVNAAQFKPVIPEDYKKLASMKLPAMNEESAIEGLRTYLKYFEEYPKKLDMMTLNSGFSGQQKNKTEAAKQLKKKIDAAATDEEKTQVIIDEMAPIQSLGMFYMTLMQEKKDPAYYGKTVTPGDAQAVLLRWKASDTTYKVIMGDLSTTEMSADQLKQIEPAPEQPPTNP